MSNVQYRFEKSVGYGTLPDGTVFKFDAERFDRIKHIKWYPCNAAYGNAIYITNSHGRVLHHYLMSCPLGYEVDHINMDTLDNRRCNLRVCTHQQNQCNQDLQRNNTSGVTGVSFYPPRGKFRARIKASQHEIHLGYFSTFKEAVQARNEGIRLMFGEYGRLNEVPEAPDWIRKSVFEKCSRFFDKAVVPFTPLSAGT